MFFRKFAEKQWRNLRRVRRNLDVSYLIYPVLLVRHETLSLFFQVWIGFFDLGIKLGFLRLVLVAQRVELRLSYWRRLRSFWFPSSWSLRLTAPGNNFFLHSRRRRFSAPGMCVWILPPADFERRIPLVCDGRFLRLPNTATYATHARLVRLGNGIACGLRCRLALLIQLSSRFQDRLNLMPNNSILVLNFYISNSD